METMSFEHCGCKCEIGWVEDNRFEGSFHLDICVKNPVDKFTVYWCNTDGFDSEPLKIPDWAVHLAEDMAENPSAYFDEELYQPLSYYEGKKIRHCAVIEKFEESADKELQKTRKEKNESENYKETFWKKTDRKRQSKWKKQRRQQRKFRHDFAFEI